MKTQRDPIMEEIQRLERQSINMCDVMLLLGRIEQKLRKLGVSAEECRSLTHPILRRLVKEGAKGGC